MIEVPDFEYEYVTFKRLEPGVPDGYVTITKKKTPIYIRMLRRCVEKDNGCWEFTGTIDKKSGYGKIGSDTQGCMKYTHRVSSTWFWLGLSGDQIPTTCNSLFGLEFSEPVKAHIHHECRNRKCVNPKHLYWVSALGNGRLGGNDANALKTGCPLETEHGPYDKVYLSNGNRYCSKCKCAKQKRYMARKKRIAED